MPRNLTYIKFYVTPVLNISESATEMGYNDIIETAFFINKYYLWAILVTGFPGNLATIITISRMRILRSFTFYVVLLAIVDNLAILVKIIIYQLDVNDVDITNAGCMILSFLGNFLTTLANWVLVLMAVERLIAVRYPLKCKKYLGFRASAIAVCTTGGIIGAAYTPVLWFSMFHPKDGHCVISVMSESFKLLFYWINVSLFALIPFIAILFCNLLIVHIIKVSLRLRCNMRNQQATALKKGTSYYEMVMQRQIMLMLFTATLVFVLLLFPICVFKVTDNIWEVSPLTRQYAIKYLCNQLAFVLCDSTHAVNFYLYFLSAKKFRNHFISTCSLQS